MKKIFEFSVEIDSANHSSTCHVGLNEEDFDAEDLKELKEIIGHISKAITFAYIKKNVELLRPKDPTYNGGDA